MAKLEIIVSISDIIGAAFAFPQLPLSFGKARKMSHGLTKERILSMLYVSCGLCLANLHQAPALCREEPKRLLASPVSAQFPNLNSHPPLENNTKNMALTEHEKQIAKDLGFEESVLLLLKERLNPEMGIVKSGGLEMEDRSFLKDEDDKPPLMLEKDLKNYHDIASKYPELKKIVDFELPKDYSDSLERSIIRSKANQKKELGAEKFERMKAYRHAAEPFQSLIAQDHLDTHGRQKGGMVFVRKESTEYLESDEALKKAIAELHSKYDGKTLRPENRAKLLLGLKYKGVGDHTFGADRRMAALQAELQALGYRIADERGISLPRIHFETKAEAEKFLLDAGMTVDTLGLNHQKKLQYKAIYPFDLTKDLSNLEDATTIVVQSSFFMDREDAGSSQLAKLLLDNPSAMSETLKPGLRLLPGSTVSKIDDRHWLIDRPERYIVSPMLRVSTVFKTPKASSGFDMVRAQGTNGLNYSISNEDVIDKLKYWDKKYGVIVVEATFESMKVSFKKLPDDLSELCTEFFLFCPDIEMSADEHSNAARMRSMADSLKKTKVMSFWWD